MVETRLNLTQGPWEIERDITTCQKKVWYNSENSSNLGSILTSFFASVHFCPCYSIPLEKRTLHLLQKQVAWPLLNFRKTQKSFFKISNGPQKRCLELILWLLRSTINHTKNNCIETPQTHIYLRRCTDGATLILLVSNSQPSTNTVNMRQKYPF